MNLEEQLHLARRFAPKPAPALSRPPKARLELAALEDRLVPSSPATFYVTNGNSSGAGSLAAAAAAADANGNNDTIVILDATDGVTDITLDAPIINGASSNLSLDIKTEDGQQVSIHPDTLHQYAFRFINLTAPNGMALTLSDLNLSYFGSPQTQLDTGDGGTIYSVCPLTVHGCAINNSRAAGNGGAIFARYSLTVDQSSFLTFNTAGGSGGAIYSKPDDTGAGVTITDSQLEYNTATAGSGGALYFNTGNGTGAGALNISGDTTLFASNQAGQRGGAVFQLGGTISATSSSSAGANTGFQGDFDGGVSGSTESASELDLEQVQVVDIDINVSGGSDPNNWAIWLDTEPPPGSPSQINTSRVTGGDTVISRNF